MSEYGGIRWTDKEGWGYGVGPKDEAEFFYRYKGLTEAMLFNELVLIPDGLYLVYSAPIAIIALVLCNVMTVVPLIITRSRILLRANVCDY